MLLLQKDVSVIKSELGELKKTNIEFEKTLQFLSAKHDEMETFKKVTMENNKVFFIYSFIDRHLTAISPDVK